MTEQQDQAPPVGISVRPLVLASSSPYRRELLNRLGIAFATAAPHVDERALPGEAPLELVRRLAEAKARAAAGAQTDALVIGSDQVAVLNDTILGKPGGHDAAVRQLLAASGRTVQFLTAVCLLDAATGRARVEVVPCKVRFRPLTRDMIEGYLRRERPYDCAGAFKSEGLGIALIERLEGEDPTALIGLPLIRLARMLEEAGVRVV